MDYVNLLYNRYFPRLPKERGHVGHKASKQVSK